MKDDTELDLPAVKDQTDPPRESAADYDKDDGSAEMSWSPGAIIKRAREAKNLTISDLSLQIKLPVRTLKALETDDFDALSEPVFVRGYYRRCAQALGVPSGDVAKAYERASGEPPPGPLPLKPMMAEESYHQPKRWLPYALFIIVAGLLVASLFWWGRPVTQNLLPGTSDNTTPNQTAAPSDSVALPSPDSDSGAMPLPDTTTDNTSAAPSGNNSTFAATPSGNASRPGTSGTPSNQRNKSVPGETGGRVQQPAQSQASSGDTHQGAGAKAAATGSAAPAKSTLDVTFNQESWVRIVDANGKRLLNGLVPAGVEHKLSGKPPFDVLLGYAPGVTITLNGKPVSLGGSVQSNNTAHVEVGGS